MATGLVRCDHCQKTVEQQEAHGWMDVRVWVTKMSPENLERMKQDPQMARLLESQGIEGADLPALVGGDFCCLDHLVQFYQAQQTLENMPTTEDTPKSDKHAAFEEWYAQREAAKAQQQLPPDPPMIQQGPPDA